MANSQLRVLRGCHVKGVLVDIQFVHKLETAFLLILKYCEMNPEPGSQSGLGDSAYAD